MLRQTIIIFSPGFGIRKGTYNLFHNITQALQTIGVVFDEADYCQYNEQTHEVFVLPFSEQATILKQLIDQTAKENPDADIVLIGQSQGCAIISLCDLSAIKKVIMISPFFYTDKDDVLQRYDKNPGVTLDITRTSYRKRTDGTTTVIPASHRSERFATDIIALYNTTALHTDVILFYGLQDRVMQFSDHHKLKNMYLMNLDGDHDFRDEPGEVLIEKIKKVIM